MRDSTLRVVIDRERCEGHTRCLESIGPLLEIDEFGYPTVHGDGVVPDQMLDAARLAAANCPERAVALEGGEP